MDVSVFMICTNNENKTTLVSVKQRTSSLLIESRAHIAIAERHCSMLGYSVLAAFDEFEEAYKKMSQLPKKTTKCKLVDLPLGSRFVFSNQLESQNVKVLLSKENKGLCVTWQGTSGPDLKPTPICDSLSDLETIDVFAVNESVTFISA